MATSNNPRKFSEKIALHNQKQAEETAAFEEVMKDLNITRAARLQLQKTQYLQLGQSRGQCYGGSLPNVNQIGTSNTDLPFQNSFQTSALDTSRSARNRGLVDRVYRDRNRISSPHRRPLSVDKQGRQIDSCPYGSVYLSPPPDTSWRRTNSDSALHQSAMNPASQDSFTGGSQELQPKRVLLLAAPGTEDTDAEMGKDEESEAWGDKKNGASRPKSCEVPGINIFPSPDQELSSSLAPAAHNTGGSLPDLTNIQFPPPLPTPLDPEDPVSFPSLSSSSSTGNLSANLTHLGIGNVSPGLGSPQGGSMGGLGQQPQVLPLSLSSSDPQQQQTQQQQQQQLSPTLSPQISLTQALSIDGLSLEQQLAQYPLFSLLQDLQKQQQQQQQHQQQQQQQQQNQGQGPQPGQQAQQQSLPQGIRLVQLPPLTLQPSSTSSSQQSSPNAQQQQTHIGTINSYRNQAASPANQSPTSPVSNQGFSPGGSPQHIPLVTSISGDSFYEHQLASRQTNALSQQLEQFNMIENANSSTGLFSTCSTLNYTQAAMMGLTGSHGTLPDSPQLGYSNHGNIPNIVLTVTGESPPSLSKELASSLVGVGDVSFDTDSQFPLDELKIDPLTLDGLHMLNDPDMVLADPATEDTFRMDRL